jgi:hypothetical protein
VRNRGVVVEIAKRNHIIVMTSRGEFVQVPFKKQVYVGQEVSFKQKERITPWQVGAAAMLFFALVSSWNMFIGNLVPGMNTPAFLITLDFNPSIELSVSEAHKVLAASGLNDDGEALISRINVVGEPLTLALERISTQAEQDGYLRQGAGEIIVTIAARDSQDTTFVELKNSRTGDHSKLEQAIVGALTQNSLAQVRIWQVPTQVLVDAKTAGITPARYIAIRLRFQHPHRGGAYSPYSPSLSATGIDCLGTFWRKLEILGVHLVVFNPFCLHRAESAQPYMQY